MTDTVLRELLRKWARQYLRMQRGGILFPDGTWLVDGWPEKSASHFSDKALPRGNLVQHFPEVYTGDAVLIWRALGGAPERVKTMIVLHYVVRSGAKRAAAVMKISKQRYWQLLEVSHAYIQARLDEYARLERLTSFEAVKQGTASNLRMKSL